MSAPRSIPAPQRQWPYWLILAVVALSVHVAFVAESNRHTLFQIPVIDAASYHKQALAIVQGSAPAHRAFWQPPLYPYWRRCTP